MPDTLEGGCFCKAVRYRLTSAPMFVHCCHCRNCQNQTGSAFVVNAMIETEQIEVLAGTPEVTTIASGNGRPHDVYRCPECRVAVWSDYGRRPGVRFVRVGTFDDPSALTPDVHIFTRTKLPWVTLPENAPAFEVFYDPEQLWPPANLERRRKATRVKSGQDTNARG